MKIPAIVVLLLLACPLLTWSQSRIDSSNTPRSGNLNLTRRPTEEPPVFFTKTPCMMANGVDVRPFPCEFRFDKLEIFGKNGALLTTITDKNSTVSLLRPDATKAETRNGVSTVTYVAKAYFTRINSPAFPVKKGYLIERGDGLAVPLDPTYVTTLATGIQVDNALSTKKVVPFGLTWTYHSGKESLFMVHIENDVTRNNFTPKPGTVVIMRDRAEASMIVNAKIAEP